MQAAAAPELRPLGIGEVLDVGIKIVWRNAVTMVRIVVPVVLPVQLLSSLINVSAESDKVFATNPTTGEVTYDESKLWLYVTGFIAILLLGVIASTLSTGACFKGVGDAYLGERASARGSLGYALRRVHSIVWITVLGGLIAALGLLLCVLPGIWLYVSFAVAVPVLLTEGLKGRKALGRSRRLIQGRWWPAFAIILLGALLTGIVSAVVGGLLEAASLTNPDNETVAVVTGTIGNTIATALTTPFSAAFVTVLYFDLRVRKEGFDLQLLAERLGLAAPPEGGFRPPPPAPDPGQWLEPASGEQPPYWPPPPGWKPGEASTQPAPPEEPPRSDLPPYWPPPPGWKPSSGEPTDQ